MSAYQRFAARAATAIDSQSGFRSFGERIGLAGLAMMLLSAMTRALWAHTFTAMEANGGHGSLSGHGG